MWDAKLTGTRCMPMIHRPQIICKQNLVAADSGTLLARSSRRTYPRGSAYAVMIIENSCMTRMTRLLNRGVLAFKTGIIRSGSC